MRRVSSKQELYQRMRNSPELKHFRGLQCLSPPLGPRNNQRIQSLQRVAMSSRILESCPPEAAFKREEVASKRYSSIRIRPVNFSLAVGHADQVILPHIKRSVISREKLLDNGSGQYKSRLSEYLSKVKTEFPWKNKVKRENKGDSMGIRTNSHNLIRAVKQRDIRKTRAVLIENKHMVNACDAVGRSLLHWAAKKGDLKMAKLLIKSGGDVNYKDTALRTPLFIAVKQDNYEMTTCLLNSGADLYAKSLSGSSVFEIAKHGAVSQRLNSHMNCLMQQTII